MAWTPRAGGRVGGNVLALFQRAVGQLSESHRRRRILGGVCASRTTFFVNQTVAYSPCVLVWAVPDRRCAGPRAQCAARWRLTTRPMIRSFTYGTVARVSHGLTRRGTISASAELNRKDFLSTGPIARRDSSRTALACPFRAGLTRNASLTLGYRFQRGLWHTASVRQRRSTASISALITRGRSRPLGGRRIRFSLGSSVAQVPDFAPAGLLEHRQFRMLGGLDVRLSVQPELGGAGGVSPRTGLLPGADDAGFHGRVQRFRRRGC